MVKAAWNVDSHAQEVAATWAESRNKSQCSTPFKLQTRKATQNANCQRGNSQLSTTKNSPKKHEIFGFIHSLSRKNQLVSETEMHRWYLLNEIVSISSYSFNFNMSKMPWFWAKFVLKIDKPLLSLHPHSGKKGPKDRLRHLWSNKLRRPTSLPVRLLGSPSPKPPRTPITRLPNIQQRWILLVQELGSSS